jgi:hypothetical protein
MNKELIKDVAKSVKKAPIDQELSPGQGRRYEPAAGVGKHNSRIHRESKVADSKNLPFSFRKPPKPKGRPTYIKCDNCGCMLSGTTATVGIICPECKKFSSVTKVEA